MHELSRSLCLLSLVTTYGAWSCDVEPGGGKSYPFFPPFLRDSAGVVGGEGERRLFLPAELALRSLRSGVRED